MSTATLVERIVDVDELTPYERGGGVWLKRDDLFRPYDDVPLSGGKVRQAMQLLGGNAARIRDEHGGVVLTATGVHSPQGLIIARVAAAYGLKCVIFIGGTTVVGALIRHPMLMRALRTGATFNDEARLGYETTLIAAAKRWQSEHGRGYLVRFGINLEDDPEAIIGSTARQVANTPESVETIVVPVGAGITAAGIILGCAQYRPDVRVVCVQISGYDRRDVIDRITGGLPYDWHVISDVPYVKHVHARAGSIWLDPIYEAKAWRWLREQELPLDERVAFWIVGDSRAVRRG